MSSCSDTTWMKGSFGISSHWTSNCVCEDGTKLSYSEAVNAFDVERYADTLESVGARHCIFTLTHAKQYLACPNSALDKILAGRTAKRDLLGEIIDALAKRHIRFIAYYNHSCNGNDDVEWRDACGYSAGIKGNLNQFAENIFNVVRCISKQYGTGISGWWFDSAYSVDTRGPINTVTTDLGAWQFPWEDYRAAAKSGNPQVAITFNAGVGVNFLYAPVDYYAGETVSLDEVFTPDPLPGIQDHRWITIDHCGWVYNKTFSKDGFAPMRFPMADLFAFREKHLAENRMVTFNVQIDQTGKINPKICKQIMK